VIAAVLAVMDSLYLSVFSTLLQSILVCNLFKLVLLPVLNMHFMLNSISVSIRLKQNRVINFRQMPPLCMIKMQNQHMWSE